MNPSHLWKFMLLTVTLWLAFAVASPAQCSASCAAPVSCGSGGTCTVTVSLDVTGTKTVVTPDTVCVNSATAINDIQWQTPTGSYATWSVSFDGGSTPLVDPADHPVVYLYSYPPGPTSGAIPSQPINNCYKYTVQYCPQVGPCAKAADPQVVVSCNNGTTDKCNTLPKRHQ